MELQQDSPFFVPRSRPEAGAAGPPSTAPGKHAPTSKGRRIAAATLAALVWLYLGVLLAVWLTLYFAGDRWWLATIMLFAPRSVYAFPLAVLVPAAALCRRRLLWPLAAAVLLLVWPIMGFCLPWARLSAPGGRTIRILTCNVDGNNLRGGALRTLVLRTRPDVIALQEFGGTDEWFRKVLPEGFHVVYAGELVLASQLPLREESRTAPDNDGLCCVLETPDGPIRICCLHLFTPRRGLAEVLDRRTVLAPSRRLTLQQVIERRRRESQEVGEWIAALPQPVLLAGDFNMPSDSLIYRNYWSAYGNAFAQAGLGFGDTKITALGPASYGLRIDHVLFGPRWQAVRAWVGPDVGSDHLPLLADLAWKPSSGDN
jgi:endonuclease/exonuclease/phosphatase (EEP) superfamily protein YafD